MFSSVIKSQMVSQSRDTLRRNTISCLLVLYDICLVMVDIMTQLFMLISSDLIVTQKFAVIHRNNHKLAFN